MTTIRDHEQKISEAREIIAYHERCIHVIKDNHAIHEAFQAKYFADIHRRIREYPGVFKLVEHSHDWNTVKSR